MKFMFPLDAVEADRFVNIQSVPFVKLEDENALIEGRTPATPPPEEFVKLIEILNGLPGVRDGVPISTILAPVTRLTIIGNSTLGAEEFEDIIKLYCPSDAGEVKKRINVPSAPVRFEAVEILPLEVLLKVSVTLTPE